MEQNKKTPLYERHIALNAKMTSFAGYEMPVYYQGIKEEHLAVRNQVGLFDVSHMGEFIIKGKEALQLVQYVSSNDAERLQAGQAQYSCLPNAEGGIVDDMLVYRLFDDRCAEGEQAFMLVVNASNIEKDLAWINEHNHFDASVENISDRCGLVALQGPKASEVLQAHTDIDLSQIKFYHFVKGQVGGKDNILVSATGYTGSGGYEIYCRDADLPEIWDMLIKSGEAHGILPCGLGARDTLRLEMGYCLYGNDIDDHTNPFKAGLGWITKLNKTPFLAGDVLKAIKENGQSERLCGFKVLDRRVPRNGYEIFNENDEMVGRVTSGTMSPSLGVPVGLGYVKRAEAKSGTSLYFKAGKKQIDIEICKLPFYK